jgi:hypothetical protein
VSILYARRTTDGSAVKCGWTNCRGKVGTLRQTPSHLQFYLTRGFVQSSIADDGMPVLALSREARRRMHRPVRQNTLTRPDEIVFVKVRLPLWAHCPENEDHRMLVDPERLGDVGMTAAFYGPST